MKNSKYYIIRNLVLSITISFTLLACTKNATNTSYSVCNDKSNPNYWEDCIIKSKPTTIFKKDSRLNILVQDNTYQLFYIEPIIDKGDLYKGALSPTSFAIRGKFILEQKKVKSAIFELLTTSKNNYNLYIENVKVITGKHNEKILKFYVVNKKVTTTVDSSIKQISSPLKFNINVEIDGSSFYPKICTAIVH